MNENNNTENRGVTIREASEIEEIGLPVEKVLAQVQRVQDVMRAIMKEGEHYGTIPGCKKPSLYKPGAEKLGFTFRLSPKFEIMARELSAGHREYEIICRLYTINGEKLVGEGVGSCSTMEAKYRYRTGPKESTGREVPKDYWTLRKTDPQAAQALLGGRGFAVAKSEQGTWEIVEQGERIEHDNPADHYNTVLKMAKKRAHVDAILTATAASDIFTQDIEEEDVEAGATTQKPTAPTVRPPQAKPKQNGETNGLPAHDGKITGLVSEFKPASGKSPARFKVAGETMSTFDEKLFPVAEICQQKGIEVDAFWKENKGYKNAVYLEAHVEEEAAAETEPAEALF